MMTMMILAMIMISKYSLPAIDFATRYSDFFITTLLEPYSESKNPTRWALLIKHQVQTIRKEHNHIQKQFSRPTLSEAAWFVQHYTVCTFGNGEIDCEFEECSIWANLSPQSLWFPGKLQCVCGLRCGQVFPFETRQECETQVSSFQNHFMVSLLKPTSNSIETIIGSEGQVI